MQKGAFMLDNGNKGSCLCDDLYLAPSSNILLVVPPTLSVTTALLCCAGPTSDSVDHVHVNCELFEGSCGIHILYSYVIHEALMSFFLRYCVHLL